MPKFSIITPTYNRADGRLQRCLTSVQAQACRDFEHIVVDDGSTDDTEAVCAQYPVHYIKIDHGGRVVARNAGMAAAEGEWFCWLDSDDGWDMMYLETFDYHIRQEPEARLWVAGVVMHGVKREGKRHTVPVWTKLRPAWMPPVDCNGVHSDFRSGKIGTGMFVYHRECYNRIGLLPPWKDHLAIADGIDDWLGYETGYSAEKKWVGNPFGEDHAYFRRLTQFYRVHCIDACLYVHYVR